MTNAGIRSLNRMAAVLLLATLGCATMQTAREPEVPVFRYEKYVDNEGFRGKFSFQNLEVITVMPDKQATDTAFKWTGAIMGRLMKDRHTIDIVRLDKDLIWNIDMKEKQYLEFPMKKLSGAAGKVTVADDAKAETVYVEDCTKCQSSIKRPGVRKIVNDHDAEQIVLTMKCKEEQGQGKPPQTTTINLEIWMAPSVKMGPEMDAFSKAMAAKSGMDMQVQVSAAAGQNMVAAYPALKDLAAMTKDLKGYPILSVLTIENDQYLKQQDDDRKRKAEQDSKQGLSTSPTAMVSGFVGKLWKDRQDEKQKEEDLKWGNVLWRVSWGSRNFARTSVSASEFNLPDGLKKIDQKEYGQGGGQQAAPGGEPQSMTTIRTKPANYVHSVCLASLTEAQLGVPIYNGASVDRSAPYNESAHNTQWYYLNKNDYRVRYVTPDPMDKVVDFYEKKMKAKCQATGGEHRETVCSQSAGAGLVRTFKMTDKPIEMSTGSENVQETASASESAQKKLPFELSVKKTGK